MSSDNWERLGRRLLRHELEKRGEKVATEFRDASTELERGADLEDIDTDRLRLRVEEALTFLDTVDEITDTDE